MILIVYWIVKKSILLILKTSKVMLKAIAKKLGKVLAPLVLKEIIIVLEEVIKLDINQDGKIGK